MSTEVRSSEVQVGLEDVVVAATSISHVDGQSGKLYFRGYDAIELAKHASYEETVYLLLYGDLPTAPQLNAFSQELARERRMTPALLDMLCQLPGAPLPIDALRTIVSAMSAVDPSPLDKSRGANQRRVKRLIAQLPTLLTAHCRMRQGESPMEPRMDLGHAANFYYMLHGEVPTALQTRILDMCLILMAEHDLNASTFAVRVVASTLSDIYAAFIAGLGALNGPLHGAANAEVMKMLLEVNSLDKVETFVTGALSAKKRIMGFGHRVYKTWDPRAVVLHEVLSNLDGNLPNAHWCKLAEKVEETVFKHKALYANVDFYAGPAMYSLGFPLEAFPAVFACSRAAGWGAHALEQYENNRLIRPSCNYVGPLDRKFVPLDQR